ncbi:hypothetical protein PQR57_35470 [Paraburkholderia dipogonis]|uniref:Prevent-host-death protein n=1 Tax=Paraburkholderia dipogonis TaxID=1211383 RepID=A0ABW9B299_9BURK
MRHLSFDLAQAGAAVRAGGVLSAILRAGNGTFHLELETRESGLAELVTANGRRRRTFREPGAALRVVRELGIVSGRFVLEDWDTRAPRAPAWTRPDQSAGMKARHRRAEAAVALEADARRVLAQAGDQDAASVPAEKIIAMLDDAIPPAPKRTART